METWRQRAKAFRTETYALYLAYRDPGVPWYAKLLAACIIGYAFSPIDLIPDFIPILGHLDDLVLIPLGIALAVKMIPQPVLAECRKEARETMSQGNPVNWVAAGAIIAIWLLLAALAVILAFRILTG